MTRTLFWVAFAAIVVGFLAIDLGILHPRGRKVSVRGALAWSAVWLAVALAFGGALFLWRGPDIAIQFLTGYLIEKSLSIDILFVFLLIFAAFGVPERFQHGVLFWGIVGALVVRFLLIALGIALVESFHWVTYALGAFLALTGIRLLVRRGPSVQPGRNVLVRAIRRVVPVTKGPVSGRFLARRDGGLAVTPLLLALIAVETTDLVFALDSIPAILAISRDPMVVYSANAFALLGMRMLYFALAGIVPFFHYLRYAFGGILVLAGARMLLAGVYEIPIPAVLAGVGAFLLAAMVASVVRPQARQIEALLHQGEEAGEFQREEVQLVERVLDMGDRRIATLMTPRPRMVWLDPGDSPEALAAKVRRAGTGQMVVAAGGLDRVIGVVRISDLLAEALSGRRVDLAAAASPTFTVPEHARALDVLAQCREAGAGLALVIDEYGTVAGMVTVHDVAEAIMGGDGSPGPALASEGDATWRVDGTYPVEELVLQLEIEPLTEEERSTHHTVGGLALHRLGRMPRAGDRFPWRDLEFEVLRAEDRRVGALRVRRRADGRAA